MASSVVDRIKEIAQKVCTENNIDPQKCEEIAKLATKIVFKGVSPKVAVAAATHRVAKIGSTKLAKQLGITYIAILRAERLYLSKVEEK